MKNCDVSQEMDFKAVSLILVHFLYQLELL